jgi:type II secretory pathway pseudopilin PulG
MSAARLRTQRGVTIVEFALVAPLIFVFIFGLVDFSRAIQANTTVAEAARQAARQAAANADATPDPFGTPDANPCSGTVFTKTASGQGCLRDTRLVETANSFMAQGGLTKSLTLHSNTGATACRALAIPPQGSGIICIAPNEHLPEPAPPAAATCPGPADVSTERNRASEWADHLMRSCYVVQVTVIYTYAPLTGLLQNIVGNRIVLVSTTSTIAEY